MYNDKIDINKGQWSELILNYEIFKEKDKEIIFTIYLLGGSVTASELASMQGVHPSSYNIYVVNLSKRIINNLRIDAPKNNNGEIRWWHVLFLGEYVEYNHFKWILRPELKEAINDLIDKDAIDIERIKRMNEELMRKNNSEALNKGKNIDFLIENFEQDYEDTEGGEDKRNNLIHEFRDRFPLERFNELTLEDYALGKEPDNLCWWLEYNSNELGSVKGGSARKHKIYYKKENKKWIFPEKFKNEREAWEVLRTSLYNFITNFSEGNSTTVEDDFIISPMMRSKLLYMYFSEKMVPIFKYEHIVKALQFFEIPIDSSKMLDGIYVNLKLKEFKENNTLFNKWTDHKFMMFVYKVIILDAKCYKIALGENAKYWEDCFKNSYIRIGWGELGDLSKFVDYKEFQGKFIEAYSEYDKVKAITKANELWSFYSLKEGDKVVANKGTKTILGVGEVTEKGYFFDDEKEEFNHIIYVKWIKDFEAKEINSQPSWAFTTLRAMSEKLYKKIVKDYKEDNSHDIEVKKTSTDNDKVSSKVKETYTEEEEILFSKIESNLNRKGNIILYGPPGTGKTYIANKYLKWCEDNDKNIKKQICTFHPSFNYEDFIEGYKPIKNDGEVSFTLTDGIFKALCNKAKENQNEEYYLIIDEINRGNVEKIFGEMITLIEKDKRGLSLTLSQSGEEFYVPSNVFIIATMNTTDKSIRMLDAAIRRRFSFIECMPNYRILDNEIEEVGISPASILSQINKKLRYIEDREKQIGHAYLMNEGKAIGTVKELKEAFIYDIIPLISEYCFNDYRKMGEIIGEEFIDSDNEELKEELIDGNEDYFISILIKKFGESDD